MGAAKYLIRIDDICEGLNIENFKRLIDLLNKFKIRPIIAVVPSNKDKKLKFSNSIYGDQFWSLIRKLQNEYKWKVGIHGYEHKYTTTNSGLLKINNFSEFAGLKYSEQFFKIEKAVKIMKLNKVTSDLFIAPAHSFDNNTIKVLLSIGIKTISDGFYKYPGRDKYGLFWIPQQLWNFSKKKSGIWTINFHINEWKDKNFEDLNQNLVKYQKQIYDYEYVINKYYNKRLNLFEILRNRIEINKNTIISYLVKIKNKLN